MKRILTTTAIFILSVFMTNLKAQNNLQFNTAKYLTLTGTSIGSPSIVDSIVVTVQTGKVWKIESVGANAVGDISSLDAGVFLNGSMIGTENGGVRGTLSRPMPIWLPAGTYTFALVYTNTDTPTVNGYISAIEFNLVP